MKMVLNKETYHKTLIGYILYTALVGLTWLYSAVTVTIGG